MTGLTTSDLVSLRTRATLESYGVLPLSWMTRDGVWVDTGRMRLPDCKPVYRFEWYRAVTFTLPYLRFAKAATKIEDI